MKSLRNQRWPAFLLALMLCLQPVTAAAQSDEGTSPDEAAWNTAKFLDFAICAVSIAAASTGAGAALAVITCAKAAHTWWSE